MEHVLYQFVHHFECGWLWCCEGMLSGKHGMIEWAGLVINCDSIHIYSVILEMKMEGCSGKAGVVLTRPGVRLKHIED